MCIHSEDPDRSKRLHCTFETRISKAGMFEVVKNAKRYDANNSPEVFGGGAKPTFHVFPFIWKLVGDSVLQLDMGNFGGCQKIAIFTLHENCPKGAVGVNVHIAVWLIGPDGFTPIESSNDAADAYLYFRTMLQGAKDFKLVLGYLGPQAQDAANEAVDGPTDAIEPSSGQTGTQTPPNDGTRPERKSSQ